MGLELSNLMQISKLLLKNEESITLEEVANYEKFLDSPFVSKDRKSSWLWK